MRPDSNAEKIAQTISRVGVFASPAASRNARPIAEALGPYLPSAGMVVELAAGSGYHAAVLASQYPALTWQPTDADPQAVAVIRQLVEQAALENLESPRVLDVVASTWPLDKADALLCCNMIHIAPWSAAEGLFAGARRTLAPGAPLFLYGPFSVDGQHTAPSNETFDQSLKFQNPAWGVRDCADVDMLATLHSFVFDQSQSMPANNMIRIYRRT